VDEDAYTTDQALGFRKNRHFSSTSLLVAHTPRNILPTEVGVGDVERGSTYPHVLPSLACLGAPLSDFGPACAPEYPSDKREQQGKDARDRQDRSQPLLRDVLRGFAGRTGQCDAAKLVYETRSHRRSYERQYDRYH
jgi:hypothetical protein